MLYAWVSHVTALLDSGGQRAMLVDLAEQEEVEFATLSPETQAQLSQILEPGLEPINPLDAWGTGNDYEAIYAKCCLALDSEPTNGLTLFAVDLYPIDDFQSFRYPAIVAPILNQLQNDEPIFNRLTTFTRPELAEAKVKAVDLSRYNTLIPS